MKSTNQEFQSALDYLYSFVDYSLTRNLRYSPEKFNLDRMVSFMDTLGNPHFDYPVVHVAGTKGKGSTCALISSVLQHAHYRVGFYSSPHMQEYTERIRINNRYIPKTILINLVNEIKPKVKLIPQLTTFEITTALAFLYFSRMKVDIAVIEVGLGGRLDATNIVQPIISVITSISKDHVKILGNTLTKIAIEKAGIIKNNTPLVIAPQKPIVKKVIMDIASQKYAEVIDVEKKYQWKLIDHDLHSQSFEIKTNNQCEIFLEIPLLGAHQVQNTLTAYATIKKINQLGFKISATEIKKGFKQVDWPGRFEVLSESPLIIIDSAHNVDSANKLFSAINDYLPGRNVILIFGASEDKDIRGMLQILAPRISKLLISKSDHPRAADPEKIMNITESMISNIEIIPSIDFALDEAIRFSGENEVIIATGSIFIAAAIRETWKKRKKT